VNPAEEFEGFLDSALRDLEDRTLLRRLRPGAGLDFVSNDYLGLAEDPRLRTRLVDALRTLSVGAGASRLLGARGAIFGAAEEQLARFSGRKSALLFSSGYLANIGLLGTILGRDDRVLSDSLNHASLIDGIRLSPAARAIYPHGDVGAVESLLTKPPSGRTFIVTESVFSMDGDRAPLKELLALAERSGALLVVDEAHATGLFGKRGSGIVEELGLSDRVLATVHTGGKALGAAGAWVACSSRLRDLLVNRARTFVFTTAPLPLLPAALMASLEILEDEPFRRAEVHRKAALLRAALAEGGVRAGGDTPIVPIRIGTPEAALAVEEGLRAEGFDARAVRPPTVPPGTSRIRAAVRTPQKDADLRRFASAVARLLRAQAA
jgi:8-amino-7-oxononanoate synthase